MLQTYWVLHEMAISQPASTLAAMVLRVEKAKSEHAKNNGAPRIKVDAYHMIHAKPYSLCVVLTERPGGVALKQ
jgi:hypothetical protein